MPSVTTESDHFDSDSEMNEPSDISAPSFSSISNSSELSSKEEFSKISEGVSSTSDEEMDVGGSSSEVPMQQFSEHSPEHSETVVPQFPVCSYVLIGDNIDKAIKPRYMRSDQKGKQLLHYFHYFASSTRIDTSTLSHISPAPPTHLLYDRCALSLLPSCSDDKILKHNFGIMIGRILAKHMDDFHFHFGDVVEWHISHKYSEEMAKKSEIVSFQLCTSSRCYQ